MYNYKIMQKTDWFDNQDLKCFSFFNKKPMARQNLNGFVLNHI